MPETCTQCGKRGLEISAYRDRRGRLIHGLDADLGYHFCEDTPAPRCFACFDDGRACRVCHPKKTGVPLPVTRTRTPAPTLAQPVAPPPAQTPKVEVGW